jgi:PAS domain-containing protein
MSASDLPTGGDGQWQLDLQTGTAWFSDWFHEWLRWPTEVKRRRLADLRPYLPAGAWEALLLAIREHLERQVPLDMQLRVQLPGGQIQIWRMLGATQRDSRGKPVSLTGSVQEISAEQRRPDPDGAA